MEKVKIMTLSSWDFKTAGTYHEYRAFQFEEQNLFKHLSQRCISAHHALWKLEYQLRETSPEEKAPGSIWRGATSPKGMPSKARRNLREKPGILDAWPLPVSTSMNLPFRSSSQIIHKRFIHILNKKNISNYIQPFLTWMTIMRGHKIAKTFLPNNSFWLKKEEAAALFP